MKHIKCRNCGTLVKPSKYGDHLRDCSVTEADDLMPIAELDNLESPPKRQRADTGVSKRQQNQTEASDKKFTCSKCNNHFSTKGNYLRHSATCVGEKHRKTSVTSCKKCKKQFSSYRTRLRHEKKCDSNKKLSIKRFTCSACGDIFPSANDLIKHEHASSHNRAGGSGTNTTTTTTAINRHKKLKTTEYNKTQQKQQQEQQQQPFCRLCRKQFGNRQLLYEHRMLIHKQTESDLYREDPWTANNEIPPWQNEDGSENESLRNVYDIHRHLILRERVQEGEVRDTFNFPVPDISNVEQLMEHVEYIFQGAQHVFKINLSFGLVLRNVETGTFRYFAPHFTDNLFLFPQLINNRHDVENLRARLTQLDLSNYFQKQKPNSKWKPVFVTNVLYVVYRTSFPLGLSQPLPDYIVNSKSIVSFEKNPNTRQMYEDKLCFFRCLSYHKIQNIHCENLTNELHAHWVRYAAEKSLISSEVSLDSIPDLEECFKININVFELNADKTVTMLYRSRHVFSKEKSAIINLNLFEDHLSYISKFQSYASKFKCRLCSKLFDSQCNASRHEKNCENTTKLKLLGGYFERPKTIFNKLANLGITVESSLQFFPWFITFDMEAMLKPLDTGESFNLTKLSKHEPVSVSICSNVDKFKTPKFILNENVDLLLSEMINYMTEISTKTYLLSQNRWKSVFDALETLEQTWCQKTRVDDDNDDDDDDDGDHDNDDDDNDDDDDLNSNITETNQNEPPSAEFNRAMSKENVFYRCLQNLEKTDGINVQYNNWGGIDADNDDDDDDDCDILKFRSLNSPVLEKCNVGSLNDTHATEIEREYSETCKLMVKLIKRTRDQFEAYCSQIPVIGFNSAKYDLNLLKSHLAKTLQLHESNQRKFVVKKNNAYMCIANTKFRFLDMINYLPPGTSYSKFLLTFGVSQAKSYFPYEYFTNMSVLEETTLPPKEAFYSSLKQCNVLEDQIRIDYEKLLTIENKSVKEALTFLHLNEPPESKIDERYESLLKIWNENKMSSMRDYLKYYNNLDVLPMVEGVEKFMQHFENKGIDVFKDCISVPGAARKLLYDYGLKYGASFALIDKRDEDLYHTIKANIIGGPSIIFTRFHEINQTNIRNNADFPCRSVVGYDSNSLYLNSLSQPMPCGNYIRRLCENGFKPVKNNNKYVCMFDWMEWLNASETTNISHKMNNGREKRIGPYLVDGYDANTNTVYEFLGCYFHGHDCCNWKDKKLASKRFNQTKERLNYIQSKGFNLNIVWECDYNTQIKENAELKNFVISRYPVFYKSKPGRVNESEILDAVIRDTLFGFIEVDIKVPDSWDQVKHKPNTRLSPFDYFQEMCPLFCTSEINFDSIGDHMQEHARKFDLSTKPRTLLVGGMRAERLLLISPLLKWYLLHGLLVTKIHQVVEFHKSQCFKEFCQSVTHDRRQGDIDKSQELKSTLSKLVGNSAYGGTIINQEKFQKIKYLKGFRKACFAVNDPRFKQISELGDNMFESEFANTNITINSPVYLGFVILNYAKLHMLSFYYDFLDIYLNRNMFELVEMDTDSCYFALSTSTLHDAVKPSMRGNFHQSLYGNCKDDFTGDQFRDVWLPRQCCESHKLFDSRTPGLMKLEFKGTSMTALCSKSYVAVNADDISVKYSLKGTNKRLMDPSDLFKQVLNTEKPISAINRGIRAFGECSVFTYTQSKQAFNYFYCKRLVHSDGIHTSPLDIVMTPINKYRKSREEKYEEFQSFLASLSM